MLKAPNFVPIDLSTILMDSPLYTKDLLPGQIPTLTIVLSRNQPPLFGVSTTAAALQAWFANKLFHQDPASKRTLCLLKAHSFLLVSGNAFWLAGLRPLARYHITFIFVDRFSKSFFSGQFFTYNTGSQFCGLRFYTPGGKVRARGMQSGTPQTGISPPNVVFVGKGNYSK